MMANSPALSIQQLTKIYANGTRANDAIDLELRDGEIVGIIGPNGAGKTTLIRQTLGLLKPTAGDIKIYGTSIADHPEIIYEMIGYVPQAPLYYPAITIRETVRYVLGLQGITGEELVARSKSTLDSLDLIPFADAPGYQLSGGLQKATLLAMAMAKQSRILVLDEPTNLIDLVKRNQFWEVIKGYRTEKRSVLLASHNMSEIKALCDRIYFIVGGKIMISGTTGEILKSHRTPVEVEFAPVSEQSKSYLQAGQIPFEENGGIISTSFDDLGLCITFLEELMRAGGADYLKVEGPSFEKIVIQIMG